MKNKLWILIKGELNRLNKYGVFKVSIFVAILWTLILFLVNDDILGLMLPIILLIDATMMSIMYIGAEMHFEKTESTISTILVTPATNNQLILSKTIANLIHNFISSGLIVLVFYIAEKTGFIAELNINIILLFIGVILTTATFTVIGLVLSYTQKDFTGMLVNVMIGAFTLLIPSILLTFKVIEGAFWENLMLINPIEAGQQIINAGFKGYEFTYKYFVSLGYMLFGGVFLYVFIAVPKFQKYAVKQSGV